MANVEGQVFDALHHLIQNIRAVAEKNAGVEIRAAAEDFNTLLASAKKIHPGAQVIQQMGELKGGDNFGALLAKASSSALCKEGMGAPPPPCASRANPVDALALVTGWTRRPSAMPWLPS